MTGTALLKKFARSALITTAALLADCKQEPVPTALDFGDSVSIGYSPEARFMLSASMDYRHDRWNTGGIPVTMPVQKSFAPAVIQAATDDGDSAMLVAEMRTVLSPAQHFNVIIYNSGLYDIQLATGATPAHYQPNVPLDQYRTNLEEVARLAEQHADAVIWVETTPKPLDVAPGTPWDGVPAGEEVPYNQVGDEIAREHGFYTLTLPVTDPEPGDVNFKNLEANAIGVQVADCASLALAQFYSDVCQR